MQEVTHGMGLDNPLDLDQDRRCRSLAAVQNTAVADPRRACCGDTGRWKSAGGYHQRAWQSPAMQAQKGRRFHAFNVFHFFGVGGSHVDVYKHLKPKANNLKHNRT